MTSFETLLAKLAATLDGAKIGYMIIGGQAVLVHGEPRQTRDIDVTIAVAHDQIDRVIRTLSSAGLQPLAPDPAGLARQTNVLPMKDSAVSLRVDIVFSETPYERTAIERAIVVSIDGRPVRFASAEDLIIHKLVAGRPVDLQDARGIWLRKGKSLDAGYIDKWLAQFIDVPGLEDVQNAWRRTREQ